MQNEYTEYVKKEEIIRLLKEHAKDGDNGTFISDATAKQIENFPPSEDVRENVRGEWIPENRLWSGHKCSACGDWFAFGTPNFCPNCGADMRGEKE